MVETPAEKGPERLWIPESRLLGKVWMDEVLGSPGIGGGGGGFYVASVVASLSVEWGHGCPLGAARSISPGARPSNAVQRIESWVVVTGGRSNSLGTLINSWY